MKHTLIILFVLTLFSCTSETSKVLDGIIGNEFTYQKKTFSKFTDKRSKLIIAKIPMDEVKYNQLIESYPSKKDCISSPGHNIMEPLFYPYNLQNIIWWDLFSQEYADFTGYFDLENYKIEKCDNSLEYRFTLKYVNNHCYLLIEKLIY